MGQKLAIKSSKEDSEQEQKEAEEQSNIEYIKGETKEILGYKCKKAIIKTEDGGEAVIYYTEDLPNVDVSDQAQGIKGFPMEMMVVTDMMTTITRVNSIEEGKVEKIKMVVPEGYDLKTKEEFKQMFGGGM
jgi:GLPGLI family protein